MGKRINKNMVLAGLIVCLCFVPFSVVPSALAQEPIHIYGEIAGGHYDGYTIQLQLGEMIQGTIIARNGNMGLSIADNTGKSIYDLGYCSTRCGFYYAVKVDGQYNLMVTNPDTFAVGTRGYNIYYTISPTNLLPGTGSGQEPSTSSGGKSAWFWGIIAIVIVVVLGIIFVKIWLSKIEQEGNEAAAQAKVKGEQAKSPEQLQKEIARIRSQKQQLMKEMEILSKSRPQVVVFTDKFLNDSIDERILEIQERLDDLDREEEKLEKLLEI